MTYCCPYSCVIINTRMQDRVILHADLNGFYASVECFLRPELRKYPVAVCGDAEARHGIVLAKNEIAKHYGIKTGHVIWEAKQLCPNLVTVSANFSEYMRFSTLTKQIFSRYTNKVESFGIDECWLDVTGLDGRAVADQIRQSIKSELGITASVGVAWNKIFAKLASDIKKPDATTIITKENMHSTVFRLPVEKLLLVGKATKLKLNALNIFTIGQLAKTNPKLLRLKLGKWGDYLYDFANGFDQSPVCLIEEDSIIKSVGNSSTTIRDLKSREDVLMVITVLAESVASRLKDNWLKGSVIHLHLRDCNLNTWSKQEKIKYDTFTSTDIIKTAMKLFDRYYKFTKPIRSIGVKVSDLVSANKPALADMFYENERLKKIKLDFVVDEIRSRFGHFSINRAIEYLDKQLTSFNPKGEHTIHPYSFF